MTSACKEYIHDIKLPIYAGSLVQLFVATLGHEDINQFKGGYFLFLAIVLALRLAVEPIKAAQRRRTKWILNSRYGRMGGLNEGR